MDGQFGDQFLTMTAVDLRFAPQSHCATYCLKVLSPKKDLTPRPHTLAVVTGLGPGRARATTALHEWTTG
jgi:hypothetical protein